MDMSTLTAIFKESTVFLQQAQELTPGLTSELWKEYNEMGLKILCALFEIKTLFDQGKKYFDLKSILWPFKVNLIFMWLYLSFMLCERIFSL